MYRLTFFIVLALSFTCSVLLLEPTSAQQHQQQQEQQQQWPDNCVELPFAPTNISRPIAYLATLLCNMSHFNATSWRLPWRDYFAGGVLGNTGYIDSVFPRDLSRPVMWGIDPHGRFYVSIRTRYEVSWSQLEEFPLLLGTDGVNSTCPLWHKLGGWSVETLFQKRSSCSSIYVGNHGAEHSKIFGKPSPFDQWNVDIENFLTSITQLLKHGSVIHSRHHWFESERTYHLTGKWRSEEHSLPYLIKYVLV